MRHRMPVLGSAVLSLFLVAGCGEAPSDRTDSLEEPGSAGDATEEVRTERRTAEPGTVWTATWDVNGDRVISREEFSGGLYRVWDQTGDGVVSRTEWLTGRDRWLPYSSASDAWEDWDENGSEHLDPDEFARGVERTALFAELDLDIDGRLDPSEVDGWMGASGTLPSRVGE